MGRRMNIEWIPIKKRHITDDEREELGWSEDITHIFTCPLPIEAKLLKNYFTDSWKK